MTKNNAYLGDWEQIQDFFASYPKILNDLIHPDSNKIC